MVGNIFSAPDRALFFFRVTDPPAGSMESVCITAAGEFVEKQVTVKSPDRVTCNRQTFHCLLTVVDRLQPATGLCVFGKRSGEASFGAGQFPAPLDVPLYWGPHIFLLAAQAPSDDADAVPGPLTRALLAPLWAALVQHSPEHKGGAGGVPRWLELHRFREWQAADRAGGWCPPVAETSPDAKRTIAEFASCVKQANSSICLSSGQQPQHQRQLDLDLDHLSHLQQQQQQIEYLRQAKQRLEHKADGEDGEEAGEEEEDAEKVGTSSDESLSEESNSSESEDESELSAKPSESDDEKIMEPSTAVKRKR
jgi:hypothetical protein